MQKQMILYKRRSRTNVWGEGNSLAQRRYKMSTLCGTYTFGIGLTQIYKSSTRNDAKGKTGTNEDYGTSA